MHSQYSSLLGVVLLGWCSQLSPKVRGLARHSIDRFFATEPNTLF